MRQATEVEGEGNLVLYKTLEMNCVKRQSKTWLIPFEIYLAEILIVFFLVIECLLVVNENIRMNQTPTVG